jgi:hypothetical protein
MYKAVLFSADGNWVTDYRGKTKEEVWEQVNNSGSRWIFYPYIAIIKDKGRLTLSTQRICEGYGLTEWMKGKTIKTISEILENNPDFYGKYLRIRFEQV